ncbi:MAG: FtsX-like permease family protein, partial [Vicinamibacterales bacterium]
LQDRTSEWLRIMGRLRPDVTLAAAQAQLATLHKRNLDEEFRVVSSRPGRAMTPAQREALFGRSLELQPGATGETDLRQRYARPLVILMVVVGIVLLVACANVANLLLARAASRQKEISVRMAIGAGRRRVVRQLLTESVLLAAIGGGLGLLVATGLSRVLLSFVPDPATTIRASLDLRVLTFAAAVSTVTGLVFGIVPALSATRQSFALALEQGRTTQSRSRLTLNNLLVVSQVALSMVALVTGGLFLRTLQNLNRLETGFEQDRLTLVELTVPGKYDAARRAEVYRRAVDRLEAVPETEAVSFSMFGLLSNMNFAVRVEVPGYVPGPDETMRIQAAIIARRFFEDTGTRIIQGREFGREDESSGRGVVVINETMARRYFGANAVGKRFTVRRFAFPGSREPAIESVEIVGVAVDAKYRNLREAA